MAMMNPLTDLATALTEKMNIPSTDYANIIELRNRQTYQLEAHTQIIRVLSGCAWVTVSGTDNVIPEGSEVVIIPNGDHPVISSLNSAPLSFEIQSV